MKRVFIAIKINPGKDLTGFISTLRSDLKDERISWTAKENMHLTLAFLGDTEDMALGKVKVMLETVCPLAEQFNIILRGAGLFKSISDPRIIWAGIENSERLVSLQREIRTGLRKSGVSLEEREFLPHLTIGRIRNIMNKEVLRETIDNHNGREWQSAKVDEVILYESILMQSGAIYKPLEIYKLRHPAP